MYCPECQAECETGLQECPDCGLELVDELDEDEDADEIEFAPLVETTDVLFFSLVTSSLEDAGIPWFVQSEAAGAPGGPVAMVYVAEKRLGEARSLADEARLAEPLVEVGDAD